MGKGKKRKNPGVGVDFRKVKHKVGKKLPKAQNETKTDFQHRSINLPNQSVARDKEEAAVSERNLTLKELVNQLSHHNTHTRRDALSGLQQLIAAHPTEATRHAALLLEALAARISDGEQPVRTALLSLLRTAALPAIGAAVLSPFLPMLMAHLSAALTHLSADVRLDALAVLETLTEAAPQLISADKQLQAALAHYTGLASRSNRGKSVKSQALSGLLKILSSLERFLTAALGAAAGTRASSLSHHSLDNSATAEVTVAGVLGPASNAAGPLLSARAAAAPVANMQVPAAADLLRLYSPVYSSDNQQQQQPAGAAGAHSEGKSGNATLQQQSLQLLSVLFECWSEAAPASLSSAPEQESASVLVHILACTQLLLAHLSPLQHGSAATQAVGATATAGLSTSSTGQSLSADIAARTGRGCLCPGFNTGRDTAAWLQQAAAAVLPKLLKVFPVVSPAMAVSSQLRDQLQRFNLLAVQILTGFVAAGVEWPPSTAAATSGSGLLAAAAAGSGQGVSARNRGSSGSSKAELAAQLGWQDRLFEFMADVLVAGNCLPSSGLSSKQAVCAAAQPHSSAASNTTGPGSAQQRATQSSNSTRDSSSTLVMLHCIQQLLPQLPNQQRQQLLLSVNLLAVPATQQQPGKPAGVAAGVSSSVRVACLQLQLQLLLRYLYDALPDHEQETAIAAWVAAAPKLLWECGSKQPQISKLLLMMLYHAARLSLPGSTMQQQLLQAQQQLAPLFATVLPVPASSRKNPAAAEGDAVAVTAAAAVSPVLVGPLASLPEEVQFLAIDSLCFLPELQQPLLKAVALCCRLSSYSDAAIRRLLDSVLAAAGRSVPPEQYLGFVATLLSPGPTGGYVDRSTGKALDAGFKRHQRVADVVCCWLQSYAPPSELLQLLLPVLLGQWQQLQTADTGAIKAVVNGVRSCSHSCLTLVASANGCWGPASSGASAAADNNSGGVEVGSAPPSLSKEMLLQLPAVMAVYCVRSAQAAAGSTAAAAADGGESTAIAGVAEPMVVAMAAAGNDAGHDAGQEASPELAAVDSCMSLVMPLLSSAAPEQLLVPFLDQLLNRLLAGSGRQSLRVVDDKWKVCLSNEQVVAIGVHVLDSLLGQQILRGCMLSDQQQVKQQVDRLRAVADVSQRQSGSTAAADQVQKLQSALALLFGS